MDKAKDRKEKALEQTNRKRTRAAELLGINLLYKLKDYYTNDN